MRSDSTTIENNIEFDEFLAYKLFHTVTKNTRNYIIVVVHRFLS